MFNEVQPQKVEVVRYLCIKKADNFNKLLHVAVSFVISLAAPATIIKQPQNHAVDVLKNVSLHCTAVGKPRPTITWKKSDGTPVDFTDGRIKLVDDGTLFIRGLQSVMNTRQ